MDCKICSNGINNKVFVVREMMLGLREEFDYMHCNNCGSLQLTHVPQNMDKYYPPDYYSFSNQPKIEKNRLINFLIKERDCYAINKSSFIGRIVHLFKPASDFFRILGYFNLTKVAKILDVGSGNGSRIFPIASAGFIVNGIDPFIDKDITYTNGLAIYKKDIYSMDGIFDLIMLNHVLEHMPEPYHVLKKINSLLSSNGKCLVRVPIIPCYMWEKYKTDWVQIDAPRHLFIYSKESMELLAKQTGFVIEEIIYDSMPFQFLGSELYKRNVSFVDGDFNLDKKNKVFSNKEIKFFIKQTTILNSNKQGDQAAFILRKV